MKRILLLSAALLASSGAFAARSSAFGIDSFNAAVPADSDSNALFSPIGFEMDCSVFGEAVDTISRAAIAESMGVLTDFQGVYRPILDRLVNEAPSNGFHYVCARAFCLPDIRLASAEYRRRIWDLNGAGVCRLFPQSGAESWFKAKLMGEMEDFSIPIDRSQHERYRYYDLVSITAAWRGKSAATAKRDFRSASGSPVPMDFFVLKGTIRYRNAGGRMTYRLPLSDGAYLYAIVPGETETLESVRKGLKGESFAEIRASVEMVGDKNAGAAKATVLFPRLDFTARANLAAPFQAAKVKQGDFMSLKNTLTSRISEQVVRFKVVDDPSVKPDEPEYTSVDLGEVALDRPFVFFVHRPEDDVMSVIGQFTGK
ncbi:MAG: hypothetical protein E7049_02840 [Lentisphaerae bacterium]|jgi:hypothetical protein|nr:hypothetical protein [Lentisphaerota bacterium]